jgi:hypothetical protein
LSPACRLSPAGSAVLATFLACILSGCGTDSSYPKLRDIPAAPEVTTPQAERDRLKEDLGRERSGTSDESAPEPPGVVPPANRSPAVPVRKAPGHAGLVVLSLEPQECGPRPGSVAAAAIPPLRGTLQGDPARQAAREPAGLTGATRPPDGPVTVSFEPGSAELPWPVLGPFKELVAALLARQGGGPS